MAVDDGEKLFRQWTFLELRLTSIPLREAGNLLLEEVERQVFFGFEVVEKGSLRDSGFGGNLLRRGSEKALLRKQIQRSAEDFLLRPLFVSCALPGARGPG